jgi:Gamma-glutamyl phosphate reductase
MTDVTNPTGETPAAQPQAAAPSEPVTPPTVPAEQPVEEWDKERAAQTIKSMREQEKKFKQDLKELETLRAKEKQRAEAEMTETQRLQKQAEELTAKNAKLEGDLIRREVIAEVNLPSIFADRLQGTTKEELLADAKKLAELLPKQNKTAPSLNATNPANGQTTETEQQTRERLFGKQGNPFNMEDIKKRGGGVIFNK